MRHVLFTLLTVCVSATLFSGIVNGQNNKSASILNGSWKRVSIIVNGKAENNPPQQIRLFHDGFYSIIGQDSALAWTHVFGGTYEISDNLFKETTLYCTFPAITGITHWQEFTIKGDTVRFKLFKKMMDATGKEMPAPAYTRELVCVRMKK